MIRWPLLLLALAACDRVFGLDQRVPIDALVDAADAAIDVAIDARPPCEPPMGTPSLLSFTGMFRDFSPTEDETLALVARATAFTAEYTESGAATFGTTVTSTGIPGTWGRVVLSPEGDRVYLSNAASQILTAVRTGAPGSWTTPVGSGLPNGLPGRPSAGNARIFTEAGGAFREYERINDVWTAVGQPYVAATLGHAPGQLTYPNLTADGRFLIYVIPNVGTFYRIRKADSRFGTEADGGGTLTSGDVRFAVLVNCKRLYVVQATLGTPFVYTFPG